MAAACVFEPQNKTLAGLLKAQRALDGYSTILFPKPFEPYDGSEITGLPRDNFEVYEISKEEFEGLRSK
jgi:hypothetical protein